MMRMISRGVLLKLMMLRLLMMVVRLLMMVVRLRRRLGRVRHPLSPLRPRPLAHGRDRLGIENILRTGSPGGGGGR